MFKKGARKWTPLKSKVVPPGGSSFGPVIVANLLKRSFQVEADFISNSCDWNLELGRLFLRFEDQKRPPSLSYCFAPISIALRPSRPASKLASKPAPRCFVLISMVSRRWSSRLALRPASNFVSSVSSYSFCFAAILYTSLEAVPLHQLRPKNSSEAAWLPTTSSSALLGLQQFCYIVSKSP